ncbi:BTAD domain-containing putative transcriptional regulator [Micromonospora sp. 4G57]|uniref:BTAD domain-containing putative transcriptional regulator n=1 Tax=Micromonospora sicca TaxID=2202420 RepID=A0ABU5JLM2_9ACTN|nr:MULTISPECIES: BTAD domain-containing putative transcriptional regulator [unclassified Micromonospora]MDZ5446780.1 BTAD domain-containing putative transcriptional regulator [Micromonospora sp. 4G57]MDZ5493515.1 BTAD domain-containing putative transcriptional regulator [Micromonospora sp. 4G53]
MSPGTEAPDAGSSAPTSPTTADGAATADTDARAANADRSSRGVSLPSGSWVDLGLALAIAAAVALVWAHRRRRYIPRQPSAQPRVGDPDLAPMPRVVNQIRRALRRAADHPHTPDHDECGAVDGDVDGLNDIAHSAAGSTNSIDEADVETIHGDVADSSAQHATGPDAKDPPTDDPLPVAPALAHPLSAVWPPAGLGLTGPGAQAAARGFLTAALAAGSLDHPDARTQVVMPSATAATLLGAAAVNLPRTPRLTVTAGLEEALEILEAQTLHRTRLAYQHEVDTVTDLRAADPYEEPLPPVMLLADATSRHERARIAALLTQGQRLDIHGVLLGAWPDGTTVDVADDGTTTPADGDRHGPHPADVGRLAVINPTEIADLLATLAESHTGQLPAPAPTEATPTRIQAETPAQPARPTTPVNGGEPGTEAGVEVAVGTHTHADYNGTEGPGRHHTEDVTAATTDTSTAEQDSTSAGATDTSTPEAEAAPAESTGTTVFANDADHTADIDPAAVHQESGDTETARPPGRVEVSVLGAPGIVGGDPQRTLRAKSLELLVYLAVRDGTASVEAILDDLLPDAPASKAVHRLHTYVSDLRSVLRHNGGPGTYLTHPHHRYQLNSDRFDIDLWRMRAAIRAADTATSKPDRIAALRRAVDTYRQTLTEGYDYEWVEPYRETVRQEALDAAVALTEELASQPTEQLAVLDTAIGQHPYAEGLYQAAMRARAQLGHLDAVRALRRTLTRRLADIDAEPSDDTLAVADQLVADLRRPDRQSRTRRPPGANGAAA